MADLSQLSQEMKRNYKLTYAEKSDAELQAIVLSCIQYITTVPSNASPTVLALAVSKTAEKDACTELMRERKEQKQQSKAAVDAWKAGAEKRRDDAIIHLPNAVSPNGQLIAAILEDEGSKTADELLSWCDELAALNDEDGAALLSGLVSEGVIELHEDGKYALLAVCTETLYPENMYINALQKVRDKKLSNTTRSALLLWLLYNEYQGPMDKLDISNALAEYKYPKLEEFIREQICTDMETAGLSGFDPSVIDRACEGQDSVSISADLSTLKSKGILVEYYDVKRGYYFPMLGMNKQ